jgi:hypothetical protein
MNRPHVMALHTCSTGGGVHRMLAMLALQGQTSLSRYLIKYMHVYVSNKGDGFMKRPHVMALHTCPCNF